MQENRKNIEHKSDSDANNNWCTRYSHQRIGRETERLGNKRTSGDHPNWSIAEIGQNIEMCPGDWKRLAFTQTLVKGHLLTLV